MKIPKIMMCVCSAAMAAVCMAFSASATDDVAIDETNFPDETFRSYISENYDTDKNGVLSSEEIENATELSLADPVFDEDGNILQPDLDLTGIGHLKKLKSISVALYNVKNADLSSIEALTQINFSAGSVSGLVLGDMSSLEDCYLYNSDLTEVSLVDCEKLIQCGFNSNKQLTKLEIKNAPSLSGVDCSNNALVSFKLENCAMLISINCSDNRLTKLDITNCPMVGELNCSGNMIAQLDITQFKNIIERLKNNNDVHSTEPPLVVDSGTKVIGYDMSSDESSDSVESTPESTTNSEQQETNNNKTMLILILAAIVVAGAAAAVIIVMVKGGKDDK